MVVNEVTAAGLITQGLDEIITDLQTAFQSIYGSDINLDSNSPDGQMIGIFAQLKADLLDLITQVYNSFDPDVAEGAALDARVALNGIQRIGGTYTIAPVEITTDRALTLYGMDQEVEPVFTVADTSGNKFQLITTHAFGGAESDVALDFQAVDVGAVDVAVNTITTQVTIVIGVTVVNNPDPADSIGANEESDADLRLRRQVSLATGSRNSVDAMRSDLLNTTSVTDAYVYDNYTSSNDTSFAGLTIPSHTMWAIVEGGSNADIAASMYANLGYGGMFLSGTSDVTEPIQQPTGDWFDIKFNRPIYQALDIKFTLTAKKVGASYTAATVQAALAAALSYSLYEKATSQDIVEALATIVPLFTPTAVLISLHTVARWTEIKTPANPQTKFTVAAVDIAIT